MPVFFIFEIGKNRMQNYINLRKYAKYLEELNPIKFYPSDTTSNDTNFYYLNLFERQFSQL